jgi:hypothetical protein
MPSRPEPGTAAFRVAPERKEPYAALLPHMRSSVGSGSNNTEGNTNTRSEFYQKATAIQSYSNGWR